MAHTSSRSLESASAASIFNTALQRVSLRFSDRAIAAAIGLAGFLAVLPGLGARALWGDESFSVGLTRQPADIFWQWISGLESNMALYYIGLREWLAVLKFLHVPANDLLIRIPSAAAAAGAAAMVYLIGRQLGWRAVGALAAILYWLSYLQLYQSLNARGYAFEMLFTGLGWYALLRWRAGPVGNRWQLVYATSMAIAVYFHYYSIIVMAAQIASVTVIACLIDPQQRRQHLFSEMRRMVVPVSLFVLLVLPIVTVGAIHGGHHHGWVPPADLGSFKALAKDLSGHSAFFALALGMSTTVAAVALWMRPRSARWTNLLLSPDRLPHPPRATFVLLTMWIALPPVATWLVTQRYLNLHLFDSTYQVVIVPGVCLLAALGTLSLRHAAARRIAVLAIIGCAATALPAYAAAAPRVDNAAMVRWIDAHHQQGDGIVTTSHPSSVALDYYFGPYSKTPYFMDAYPGRLDWRVEDIDSASISDPGLSAYGTKHSRVFFVAYTPPYTTVLDSRAEWAMNWLDTHYRMVSQMSSPTRFGSVVVVRLYMTGG